MNTVDTIKAIKKAKKVFVDCKLISEDFVWIQAVKKDLIDKIKRITKDSPETEFEVTKYTDSTDSNSIYISYEI
jgi:hypothetical protein